MTIQYWPIDTPSADTRNPVQKHTIEMNIAQRGPLRSTAVPNTAADTPSITMPRVNGRAVSVPAAGLPWSIVAARGFLKTLQAYACPIARWIDRAAGGISHLLQPGGATMRSRCRKPAAMAAPLRPQVIRPRERR